MLREYIWLDDYPFAVIEDGDVFYLSWDRIGRPVMATDETGSVVWQASYTPFGGILEVAVDTGALTAQEHRFPGQWFQAETGLHQNWHSDYDPTTGRYLQADPLGLIDGASVYGYALQSPMRYTDPRGQTAGVLALCVVPGVGQVSCGVLLCAGITAIVVAHLAGEEIDELCDGNCFAVSIGRKGGAATGERTKTHRKKRNSTKDKHTKKSPGTKNKARSKPGFFQR